MAEPWITITVLSAAGNVDQKLGFQLHRGGSIVLEMSDPPKLQVSSGQTTPPSPSPKPQGENQSQSPPLSPKSQGGKRSKGKQPLSPSTGGQLQLREPQTKRQRKGPKRVADLEEGFDSEAYDYSQ